MRLTLALGPIKTSLDVYDWYVRILMPTQAALMMRTYQIGLGKNASVDAPWSYPLSSVRQDPQRNLDVRSQPSAQPRPCFVVRNRFRRVEEMGFMTLSCIWPLIICQL